MNATEVQNQVLREHLLRDRDVGDIRPHRVAMVVGIPIFVRLTRHAGTVAMEGVLHVDIDRLAETLCLPVARHRDFVPLAHVVVFLLEAHRTRFGILAPMEVPLTVE